MTAWPYWGLRVAAVVFYIGNWTEIRGISLGMLGHTWSLSIEEQFYLLWPLTLAVLLAIVPRRATASALVVMLAAAAFMSRVALTVAGRSPWRVYLGTDTHGDGLLVGCAAALLASAALPLRSPFATRVLRAVTPAAALGVGWLLLVSHWPGDYLASASSVANVLVAVVLLDVCAGPSLLGRLLARSGLVAVGRISYGLYLFHFPVFKMLGMLVMPDGSGRGSPLLIATGWLVAFAIAGLSFRYVERPALAFKGRVRGGQPIPASVVSRLADGRLA